jgi:hypothetical protein
LRWTGLPGKLEERNFPHYYAKYAMYWVDRNTDGDAVHFINGLGVVFNHMSSMMEREDIEGKPSFDGVREVVLEYASRLNGVRRKNALRTMRDFKNLDIEGCKTISEYLQLCRRYFSLPLERMYKN